MRKFFKKLFNLSPFVISVLLTVFFLFLYMVKPLFLDILELRALDMRFLIRGPKPPGQEVVIAVIDEKSLDEIGRWPWPRARFGEMVESLDKDGALAVAFDVGFSEADENTTITLIDRLKKEMDARHIVDDDVQKMLDAERSGADNDQKLADSIAKVDMAVVLGYFFHMRQAEGVAHLSADEIQSKIDRINNSHYTFMRLSSPDVALESTGFSRAYVPESNIPVLHEVADAAGYFNMFPDVDGTVRWVPMTIQCQDKFYMPLSLQGLRMFLGDVPSSVTVTSIGVEKVSVGPFDLPTDEMGKLLINYRGPAKTFPHYSISDIIHDLNAPPDQRRLPEGTFRDKLVLVGASAVGIYDLRVTPFDSNFPGIEVHANVIDNILHQDFLIRPGWTAILDLLAILLIGLVLGVFLPRMSAMMGPVLTLGLMALAAAGNYMAFTRGYWINITYPILTAVLVYTGITLYRYVTEEREKRWIRGAFNSYVNPSVVSEMLKNPDMLKLGGEKREATVLFSDIRGFTTISEKMDPESLTHLLNRYLTVMTDIVFDNNGLLDKYIGDAIMAAWGAPLPQPDHPKLACRTALQMMEALARFRDELEAEETEYPYMDIGIGVNSGPMVVGNLGSEVRMDYTAIGDSVNLGSRLEGANKQYGTNIIIGEMTFEEVKDDFYCRELDAVAVKGKEQPVRIFELMGEPGTVSEDRLKMARSFQRGLNAYKSQRWDQARKVFSAILEHFPDDTPSKIYLERIADLKKTPPPKDWDGVYRMTTK